MQCFGELDDPPVYKDKLGNMLPTNLQHNMNEYRQRKGKRIGDENDDEDASAREVRPGAWAWKPFRHPLAP